MSGTPKKQLEKERRAYEKATLRELLPAAQGAGWKKKENFVFREIDDHFFVARLNVWLHGDKVQWRLGVKPMAVDPVFWSILEMEENRSEPLSLRANGSFVCTEVPIAESECPVSSLPSDGMAQAFLAWAERAARSFAEEWAGRRFSGLVKEHADYRERGAYAATLISALIAEANHAEALCVASDFASGTRVASHTQSSNGKTFFELAESWLVARSA